MDKLTHSLSNKISSVAKDTDDKVFRLEDHLKNSLSSKSEALQTSIDKVETDRKQQSRAIQEKLDTEVSSLKSKVSSLEQQQNERLQDLDSKVNRIQADAVIHTEAVFTKLSKKIESEISTLTESISDLEDNQNKKMEMVSTELTDSLGVCMDKIEELERIEKENISNLQGIIDSTRNEILETVEETRKTTADEFNNKLNDVASKSYEQLQILHDTVAKIIADAAKSEKDVSEQFTEIGSQLDQLEKSTSDNLLSTCEKLKQELIQLQTSHKSSTDSKISETASELNKKVFAAMESLSDLAQQQFDLSKLHETLQDKQQVDWENLSHEMRTIRNNQRESFDVLNKRIGNDVQLQAKEFLRMHEDLRYDCVQTACKVEVLEKQMLQLEESVMENFSASQARDRAISEQYQSPQKDNNRDDLNLGNKVDDFGTSELISLSPWILGSATKEPAKGYRTELAKATSKQQDVKVAHIESELSKIKSQLTSLSMHVESNKENIDQLTSSIGQVKVDNVSNLESVTQNLIRPFAKRVETVESTTAKRNESAAKEALKTAQAISSLQNSLNDLSSSQLKISNSTNGLSAAEKESVLATANKISSIEKQVAELINSAVVFNSIEQKVDSLHAEVRKIPFLEGHIQDLLESTNVIDDIYQKLQSLKPPEVSESEGSKVIEI